MSGKEIQRFALDPEGNVVDVRKISSRGGMFFCPHCHDAMIPKMGSVKAWHFSHKAATCSYDAYLHSLAKIRIADWFNRSASVILDMKSSKVCADQGSCAFYDPSECVRPARISYDLKKYYHGCEIERAHGGFIADILCPHASAPLFIEIFVTHECSEEKKASGQRIIELAIDSEEAIDRIISSPVLAESENVRLYGFKRSQAPCRNLLRPLVKYTLHKSGKSHVSGGGINCRNYRHRQPSALYEITTGADCHPLEMYLVGKSMAHRDGFLPKDCSICFWLGGMPGSRVCKLYKRCGNPRRCEDNDARKCPMFRENRELIEDGLEMGDDLGIYEIWN